MWNKEKKNGFWKKLQQLQQPRKAIYVFSEECTGCRRCTQICRHRVLSMVAVNDKIYATACRQERCSQCGKCIVICPVRAIKLVKIINND
ncbi:MAG: 4Fe-4S binding protein [Prevotellaceae bacterium]|nr:4Fe-4S binding protein [Prevotellaceae bacterium]